MGSYARAVMTGFICRLCSEQKRYVIHFYGVKAKELQLLEKLTLLPITVEKYDNLPKTICEECIEKLNLQYNLVQKIRRSMSIQRRHRLYHSNGRCPVECPLHGVENALEGGSNGGIFISVEDFDETNNDNET
ncbi:uncharacterized protein LOC108743141 [Agrilus planipennis]|uniref:Uncharacterized protein LOC108743141 n=1 Tax=Agrilus planipennis TaxID=224129 RepID=A0A1W4XNP1_AGRPL|nr:uncharacterized protein LOC108743141 [Agrilus planipennis]